MSIWLVQPCVDTIYLKAVGRTSYRDSSAQHLRLYRVSSYIQVLLVCYIHLICVQLSLRCTCTSCTLLHLVACLFWLLVLSVWSCAAIRNPSVSFLRPCTWSQPSPILRVGSLHHELCSRCSCLILCFSCMLVSPFSPFRTFSVFVALSSSYLLAFVYQLRLCSSIYSTWPIQGLSVLSLLSLRNLTILLFLIIIITACTVVQAVV